MLLFYILQFTKELLKHKQQIFQRAK